MEKEQAVNRFQVFGKLKEVKASILAPQNAGLRIILSPANLVGKTTHPIFATFDKKWKRVKEETRGWYTGKTGAYKLGAINTTLAQSDVWVVSMLFQDEKLENNDEGLKACLKKVADMAVYEKASVHVPKELTDSVPGLKELCETYFVNKGVSVYFYQE